jgi:hypothetical protein
MSIHKRNRTASTCFEQIRPACSLDRPAPRRANRDSAIIRVNPCSLQRLVGWFLLPPNQAYGEEQHHCARCCRHERAHPLPTNRNTQNPEQPAAQNRSNDTRNDVPHNAESSTFHNQASQPSGNASDQQKYDKLVYVHWFFLSFSRFTQRSQAQRRRAKTQAAKAEPKATIANDGRWTEADSSNVGGYFPHIHWNAAVHNS